MYTISKPSGTIRKDGVIITQDDRTPEYQAYSEWLQKGNGPEVIQDAEDAPRITVSAWQIRKALNVMGLRAAVEAAVAGSGDIELQDGWQYAVAFESDHALIASMGAALGKSPEEMLALFRLAEGL